ncbi:MAG: helix-turn-helix domain-containing protein, partial [Pseudomonadota bacterium]
VFLAENGAHIADRLDIALLEEPRGLRLTTTHPNDVLDDGRVAEVGTALVVRLIREILGFHHAVIEIEIGYAPLGPAEAYAAFFRCPVEFDAGRTSVLIAEDALARPNKAAQPALFELVEHQFALSIQRLRVGRPHPDLLRLKQAAAEAASGGDYRVASVCERAGMSERTAQRIAAAGGTTVGALVAENRRAAAETLLTESTMSIEAIAALVGFSDDRAFRRAFSRWTGRSPSRFRDALMKPQPTKNPRSK